MHVNLEYSSRKYKSARASNSGIASALAVGFERHLHKNPEI